MIRLRRVRVIGVPGRCGHGAYTLPLMRRWFWILDSIVVLSFVLIGRDSHGFVSDASDILRVATPFLIALAIGVISLRAWLKPTVWLTGLNLALLTLTIGMVLRRVVFGAGSAPVFVLVTGAWFIGLMIGWRLLFSLLDRRRKN
jgi:hypothetical protein